MVQLLWPAILMGVRSARRLRGAVGGCRVVAVLVERR